MDISAWMPVLQPVFFVLRGAAAALTVVLILWCWQSVRAGRRREEPVVCLEDRRRGRTLPVLYWENSLGRSKSCDIVLPDTSVSRDHAVLMRRQSGWYVVDTGSKSGTLLNGHKIHKQKKVLPGDVLRFGGTSLVFRRATDTPAGQNRRAPRRVPSQGALLTLATVIQLLLFVQALFADNSFSLLPVLPCALVLLIEWVFFAISKAIGRANFELETIGFLLSGIGIALECGMRERLTEDTPQDLPGPFTLYHWSLDTVYTQILMMAAGLVVYSFLIWFMKDLDRVNKFRTPVAVLGLLLLLLPMVPGIGSSSGGATNWISIGGLSLQPSELTKLCFIFAGAATLDHLQTKRNLIGYVLLMAAIMGVLALERDIGAAAIFFLTFLIIAFLRSGSMRTVVLFVALAAVGVFAILSMFDHVKARFDIWRHVWEQPYDGGFQQTHVLTYAASGGLFGVGIGNGGLGAGTAPLSGQVHITGYNSDLVFGVVIEELGLVLAVAIVAVFAILIFMARGEATRSRSTFYSITANAAAGMLLVQACLNIFGATDVLPLTGVTLPFISAGGTSMMCVWGALAFIKASDERTYLTQRERRRR